MTPLQRIKDRCRIDEITGCWIWTGAMAKGGYPRIYAPDYSNDGSMAVQTGTRAVWHIVTGKAIRKPQRVFHTCGCVACVNPEHLHCGRPETWGKHLQDSGAWKGQANRIQANRAIGRKRSSVSPAMLAEIQGSPLTGAELAQKFGLARSVISKAKRGQLVAVAAVGNIFAGLMQ